MHLTIRRVRKHFLLSSASFQLVLDRCLLEMLKPTRGEVLHIISLSSAICFDAFREIELRLVSVEVSGVGKLSA